MHETLGGYNLVMILVVSSLTSLGRAHHHVMARNWSDTPCTQQQGNRQIYLTLAPFNFTLNDLLGSSDLCQNERQGATGAVSALVMAFTVHFWVGLGFLEKAYIGDG